MEGLPSGREKSQAVMAVKLQSAHFDNSTEPRMGRNSSRPGQRAQRWDGRSSPPTSTALAFASSHHCGLLAALHLGYRWPVSWGSVVAAGDCGLWFMECSAGDLSPAAPSPGQHTSYMTDVTIAPAKRSVPHRDGLQPAERLRAAAQNIWRLFPEFMQHMFSYKLNSEKMCIIMGWCSQQPSLLWITMTPLSSLDAWWNAFMQLETIVGMWWQGLDAWPKGSLNKSRGFFAFFLFSSLPFPLPPPPTASLILLSTTQFPPDGPSYQEGGQMPRCLLQN